MLNKRGDSNLIWFVASIILVLLAIVLTTFAVGTTWEGFKAYFKTDNIDSLNRVCNLACSSGDQLAYCNQERALKADSHRLSTVGLLDKVATAEIEFLGLSGKATVTEAKAYVETLKSDYDNYITNEKNLVKSYSVMKADSSATLGDVLFYLSNKVSFVYQDVQSSGTKNSQLLAYIGADRTTCLTYANAGKTAPARTDWKTAYQSCITNIDYNALSADEKTQLLAYAISGSSSSTNNEKNLAKEYMSYTESMKKWNEKKITRVDMEKLIFAYNTYRDLTAIKSNYMGKKILWIVTVKTGDFVEKQTCKTLSEHAIYGMFFDKCLDVENLCGESTPITGEEKLELSLDYAQEAKEAIESVSKCGDGECDVLFGETSDNCESDCPPSSK